MIIIIFLFLTYLKEIKWIVIIAEISRRIAVPLWNIGVNTKVVSILCATLLHKYELTIHGYG